MLNIVLFLTTQNGENTRGTEQETIIKLLKHYASLAENIRVWKDLMRAKETGWLLTDR